VHAIHSRPGYLLLRSLTDMMLAATAGLGALVWTVLLSTDCAALRLYNASGLWMMTASVREATSTRVGSAGQMTTVLGGTWTHAGGYTPRAPREVLRNCTQRL
jgi:hypothetical protein